MSDSKVPDRLPEVDRRIAGREGTDPNDPSDNWVGRSTKSSGRHNAITRNLYNWHSYKNWADRIRTDWDEKDRKR